MYQISNGQVSSGITLSHDSMYISSGGTANSITVNSSGSMEVSSGGTANSTTVNTGGRMYVSSGGITNFTTVNYAGKLYVQSDGVANSTTVNYNGVFSICDGGVAIDTTINLGRMHISSGGSASNTTVNLGSMYISSGAAANNITVNQWGRLSVQSDGLVNHVTVNAGGYVDGSAHGVIISATVNSDGVLYLGGGGGTNAHHTIVHRGGVLRIDAAFVAEGDLNGKLYGDQIFGGTVELVGPLQQAAMDMQGCNITFAVNERTTEDTFIVNNLSWFTNVSYSIQVADDQALGVYQLAEGADSITGSISIGNGSEVYGSVTVNGDALSYGGNEYTLLQTDDVLTFRIADVTPPDAPTAGADITTTTNQNVTVTATFSEDSVTKEYSLDNSTWQTYTTGVVLSANGTVYFRGIDEAGNISEVTSYTVENIDKTAPAKPVVEADITSETGKDVTVTAAFSDDSKQKQYSLDGETWLDYTEGIVFAANGMVYFRGVDEAGNISEVAEYVVANISPTAVVPDKPMGGDLGRDANYEDSYQLELDCAGKYTLSGDFGRLNGSVAIMQGKKALASGAIKNGVLTFNNGKSVLLDAANSYTLVVKNSDKGKTASDYTFTLEAATLYPRGDKGANDWTDMKTAGAESTEIGAIGVINGDSGILVDDDELSGWVGYGDAKDYLSFTLESAASLSLDLTATGAAKFTVYSLVETTKKGVTTRSLKSLQANALAIPKGQDSASLTTKNLLLNAGTYYLGVESTNAAKGGEAAYTVALNNDKSVFFTRGDNSDDWTNLKTVGAGDGAELGVIDTADGVIDATSNVLIADGWVGYDDAVDYKAFSLGSDAKLSFSVSATDAAKFTVYSLVETTKKGVKTFSLKSLQSTALTRPKDADHYSAETAALLLTQGSYYLGVESTNAAKGGNAAYTVALNNDKSVFYTEGNTSDNDWQSDGLPELAANGELAAWVGFGNAVDYRNLTVAEHGGFYNFALSGVENNVKLTVYSVVETTKKGVTTRSLKAVKSVTATAKTPEVATGNLCLNGDTRYVLAVEAPGAAKAQNSHYTAAMTEVGTFANPNNEKWETATVLDANTDGLLTTAAGGDRYDYFDLAEVGGTPLNLGMTEGKVTVSFYNAAHKAVKTRVDYANGKNAMLASVTLVAGNAATGSIDLGALSESIKYMKIEAATAGVNTYSLSLTA